MQPTQPFLGSAPCPTPHGKIDILRAELVNRGRRRDPGDFDHRVAYGGSATVLTQVAPANDGNKERWILNPMWEIRNKSTDRLVLLAASLEVGDSTAEQLVGQEIAPGGTLRVLAADQGATAHDFQDEMPHPTTAASTLHFEDYGRLSVTSALKVHRHETASGAYHFPLKGQDLPPDVYWTNGDEAQDNAAHHHDPVHMPPEGSQWYAIDIVAIDAKRYSGKVEVSRPLLGKATLKVGGRDKTKLVEGLASRSSSSAPPSATSGATWRSTGASALLEATCR